MAGFEELRYTLFISGYNNVESGGRARLFFYFLGHKGQIIYFQVFGGQELPLPLESNDRPLSIYCAKREY